MYRINQRVKTTYPLDYGHDHYEPGHGAVIIDRHHTGPYNTYSVHLDGDPVDVITRIQPHMLTEDA